MDWKKVANLLKAASFLDVLQVKERMSKQMPVLKALFEEYDLVVDVNQHNDSVSLYQRLIPVWNYIKPTPGYTESAFENGLAHFYVHALKTPLMTTQVGCTRSLLRSAPISYDHMSPEPWSLVTSHLICLAHHPQQSRVSMRDAAFICARYTGDSFTTYAHMIVSVHALCGFFHPWVVRCLKEYIRILIDEFGGEVPKTFIYNPDND